MLCALASPRWVEAATLTVIAVSDSGAGSLRQTLERAAEGDTINFKLPPGTAIRLQSGELVISKSLAIQGPGAARLTIDGSNAHRLFRVTGKAKAILTGLTLQNGYAKESDGGAILVEDGSALELSECVLANNRAGQKGGALAVMGTATSKIHRSTFLSNHAAELGGAIYNVASVEIFNSTFYGNSAEYGGAIANNGFGNTAVTHSTLVANSARGFDGGGGIMNNGLPGRTFYTLRLRATLLANPIGHDCLSTITSNFSWGQNLSHDESCYFLIHPGDKRGADLKIDSGAPKLNGGSTPTIALLPGSPALDAIPADECLDENDERIPQDQRGEKRPRGAGCDIGAIER